MRFATSRVNSIHATSHTTPAQHRAEYVIGRFSSVMWQGTRRQFRRNKKSKCSMNLPKHFPNNRKHAPSKRTAWSRFRMWSPRFTQAEPRTYQRRSQAGRPSAFCNTCCSPKETKQSKCSKLLSRFRVFHFWGPCFPLFGASERFVEQSVVRKPKAKPCHNSIKKHTPNNIRRSLCDVRKIFVGTVLAVLLSGEIYCSA